MAPRTILKWLLLAIFECSTVFKVYAQENQVLGELDAPENFDLSTWNSYIDYGIDLDTQTYDIRFPDNFDPNETYGLVTYINAGNDGGTEHSSWWPTMDKYRLIWIAGDGIGNGQFTDKRNGVAIKGAMRMTELYNIDPNRIYVSGNSGGSRSASSLSYHRDDFFTGLITIVGVAAPYNVPDDFLTDTSRDALSYINTVPGRGDTVSDVRVAIQTYYNADDLDLEGDFREQESITVYQHVTLPNERFGKLVNSPGHHSARVGYEFLESVRHMEYPINQVISDTFSDGSVATNDAEGNGFFLAPGSTGSASEITIPGVSSGTVDVVELTAGTEIRSSDAFSWNNEFGSRLKTSLRSDYGGDFNQRMTVEMVPADSRETASFKIIIEQTSSTEKSGSIVFIDRDNNSIPLCSFNFSAADDPMSRPWWDHAYFLNAYSYDGLGYNFRGLEIYWYMDDEKFQINFRHDIDRDSFTSDLETSPVLLNDRWTVQGRWEDLDLLESINSLKPIRHWRMAISNEPMSEADAGNAYVDDLELVNALPGDLPAQDGSESPALCYQQSNDADGIVVLEAEHYNRQEIQGIHHWLNTTSVVGYEGIGAVTTQTTSSMDHSADMAAERASRLDYSVDFRHTGEHTVWVRAYANNPTANSVYVGLDDTGAGAAFLSGYSDAAYTWNSQTITVDNAGPQDVYLWVGEAGLVVDKIVIAENSSYIPSDALAESASFAVFPPNYRDVSRYLPGTMKEDYDGNGLEDIAQFAAGGNFASSAFDDVFTVGFSEATGAIDFSVYRRDNLSDFFVNQSVMVSVDNLRSWHDVDDPDFQYTDLGIVKSKLQTLQTAALPAGIVDEWLYQIPQSGTYPAVFIRLHTAYDITQGSISFIYDDFDGAVGDLSSLYADWSVLGSPAPQVTPGSGIGGSHGVEVVAGEEHVSIHRSVENGESDSVWTEMSVKVSPVVMNFGKPYTEPTVTVAFFFNTDGSLEVRSGFQWVLIPEAPPVDFSKFQDFVVYQNFNTETWSLWVNEKQVVNNFSFANSSSTGDLNEVIIQSLDSSAVLDRLEISR
ncbi:MAG: hypothetical protein ACPGN3_08715 [Opitutales bacterium]